MVTEIAPAVILVQSRLVWKLPYSVVLLAFVLLSDCGNNWKQSRKQMHC